MQCYACDADAVRECSRCGAIFCVQHGDALCARCMDPAEALPSHQVSRGSLIALLVGSLFAVWLVIRPPATSDADGGLPPTSSGVIAAATAVEGTPSAGSPVDQPSATPSVTTAPGPPATTTASATATATPAVETSTPEPAPANGEQQHVVSVGDTLYSIAEQYLPPGAFVLDYIDLIAAYNGITDAAIIAIGEVIVIPPR